MPDQNMLLLTIVTESVLEDTLIDEIMALGARGYTITDARGRGTHGLRSGRWSVSSNIKIEVVGDAALVQRIVERLQAQYERDYGLLMFTCPVELQN
ncbi:MAG: transcriptional regulator [Thiobacillaceae bacterium]|nr:transcriptional regulator [Thiobacillaceae bacterium]MCX7673118.1 transcriptional regulator [Thiobacillaceae bacterium]MDW8323498.1 transcriptional regulator [Burkholderiales bacterium]